MLSDMTLSDIQRESVHLLNDGLVAGMWLMPDREFN